MAKKNKKNKKDTKVSKKLAPKSKKSEKTKGKVKKSEEVKASNDKLSLPNAVVNDKHGHVDILSQEEMKERKLAQKEEKIEAPETETKESDLASEIRESLADVIADINKEEEREVRLLSSRGASPKEEKKKITYMFYSLQNIDDNDFIVDTSKDALYDDIQEAQDALSSEEDGAVWEIRATKVLRLGKTVQKVA